MSMCWSTLQKPQWGPPHRFFAPTEPAILCHPTTGSCWFLVLADPRRDTVGSRVDRVLISFPERPKYGLDIPPYPSHCFSASGDSPAVVQICLGSSKQPELISERSPQPAASRRLREQHTPPLSPTPTCLPLASLERRQLRGTRCPSSL